MVNPAQGIGGQYNDELLFKICQLAANLKQKPILGLPPDGKPPGLVGGPFSDQSIPTNDNYEYESMTVQ
jgi:hypothetical protein